MLTRYATKVATCTLLAISLIAGAATGTALAAPAEYQEGNVDSGLVAAFFEDINSWCTPVDNFDIDDDGTYILELDTAWVCDEATGVDGLFGFEGTVWVPVDPTEVRP